MPRFAANLSMMFTERPFLERFAAAAAAGFEGVEYLFPYEHDAPALRAALDAAGLRQALFNAPPGDWAAGERGLAAIPGRGLAFREAFEQAVRYAEAIAPDRIHVMAGITSGAGRVTVTAATENVEGRFAWVLVDYNWTNPAERRIEPGRATFICERRGENWKIVHAHSSQPLPWEP